MSRQVWKGSTLLNPEPPVLVSCGAPEKPNLITVGWTGTICTQPPMLSISVAGSAENVERYLRYSSCPEKILTTPVPTGFVAGTYLSYALRIALIVRCVSRMNASPLLLDILVRKM